jgi:hypothetical protein
LIDYYTTSYFHSYYERNKWPRQTGYAPGPAAIVQGV